MSHALEKEFKYYIDHQDELVKKFNGKSIVIKGEEIIGVYDDEIEAIIESSKDYTVGSYLVQKCEIGSQNYSQTYHSRVIFE